MKAFFWMTIGALIALFLERHPHILSELTRSVQ